VDAFSILEGPKRICNMVDEQRLVFLELLGETPCFYFS
jgi:hypothetical protein